jgi:hypothetical protein
MNMEQPVKSSIFAICLTLLSALDSKPNNAKQIAAL